MSNIERMQADLDDALRREGECILDKLIILRDHSLRWTAICAVSVYLSASAFAREPGSIAMLFVIGTVLLLILNVRTWWIYRREARDFARELHMQWGA